MAEIRRLRRQLVQWYRRHRRDLPWRRTRDPFAIWVSEVMLQQTQVAAVIPYFERFLGRFPDLARLAQANEEDVLAAWSGLGYYRRARALHAGAKAVIERHAGEVPADPTQLLELPGVGPYTAGAIASIAFDRPAPILDGNVRRVLSRLFAIDARRLTPATEQRRLWSLATEFALGSDPGDANQALMELGALVCLPRAPRCDDCPLRRACAARRADRVTDYPTPRKSSPTTSVRIAVAWVTRGGRVLLERRAPGGVFRGSWDLPAIELPTRADARRRLRDALARHGVTASPRAVAVRLVHTIQQRRLRLEVWTCDAVGPTRGAAENRRFVRPSDLDRLAVSGATLKIARAMAPPAARRPGSRPTASLDPRPET